MIICQSIVRTERSFISYYSILNCSRNLPLQPQVALLWITLKFLVWFSACNMVIFEFENFPQIYSADSWMLWEQTLCHWNKHTGKKVTLLRFISNFCKDTTNMQYNIARTSTNTIINCNRNNYCLSQLLKWVANN